MARGYLIPEDWDGESYHLWAFCAPASISWDGIVRGAMYDLTRGRSWDGETGNIVDTQEITKEMYSTMSICDEMVAVLSGIEQAIIGLGSGASGCSCDGGSEFEPEESNGDVDIGPGERFPNQGAYEDAKCAASNGIYDQILDTINRLGIYDVDTLMSGGIAIAVGLVTTLIASGPIGWGVAVILGVVSGIVTLLGGSISFDLSDIKTILETDHEDLVCGLYTATDTDMARADFLSIIDTSGATPFEYQLVAFMLTAKLLNQLFNDMEQTVEDYVSPDPVDCSACGEALGCPWEFADWEGGVAGSGDLTKDGQIRTLSSRFAAGLHNLVVQMASTSGPPPGLDCDGEHTVNGKFEFVSYDPSDPTFTTRNGWYWNGDQSTQGVNFPVPPDDTEYEYYYFQFVSTTQAFTVDVKLYPGNFQ